MVKLEDVLLNLLLKALLVVPIILNEVAAFSGYLSLVLNVLLVLLSDILIIVLLRRIPSHHYISKSLGLSSLTALGSLMLRSMPLDLCFRLLLGLEAFHVSVSKA